MKTIVLIGCGARKQAVKCMAKDLYQGALFQKAYAYAQKLDPDKIYILSAKHHLLATDTEIAPYNETLNRKRSAEIKEWSKEVLNQLTKEGIDLKSDKFIILAGHNYYKYLLQDLTHYELPYQDCKGIGYILRFLNKNLG